MNRQTNHFGFGQTGRPSGIRPPSSYGMSGQSRPKSNYPSTGSSITSSASTRKGNNSNAFNFPGSANSRSSAGGARQSYANPRPNIFASARKSMTAKLGPLFGMTPQHNRQSYVPNTASSAQSNRRSSIGGNRHVKDSRPLSDSSYQRQCVSKLIAFLTDNPIAVYPHTISKTLGTRPTVGEISKIFEFLFHCYGIKSKITPMEVEIPKVMAAIEYPFPVKKSDLVSFTSGRALGSVLGMLEWIVDSLTYLYNMDPMRTFYPNFEGETDIKTELIRICLKANVEDLDPEQVDDQLNQLIVKTYGTEDDFEQLVDEQEALDQELRRLDEELQQIKDLPNSIQTYHSDIKNYDQYMNEMRAHMKSNKEVLENLEKEINERQTAIKKCEEQKKQLKLIVDEQEFGIEEANLAKERKQQLEDEIKQEMTLIDDIKKSIRNSRLECSRYEDTIKKMHSDLDSFITAMTDMVDSPVMSNHSTTIRELLSSIQWKQILEDLKSINGQTYGTNINELEKLFSKKVNELKIAIIQQLSSLKGCVTLSEQQKLNELNLLIEEKEKQMKANEKQISELMSELEFKRKEQVSQIAALQSEIDKSRHMLSELDNNKHSNEELLVLRKEVEDKQKLYENEEKSLIKEFEDSVALNKSGIEQFSKSLDSFIADEEEKNIQLKTILNKF